MDEIDPFVQSLLDTPKTGLHNPFKNKERYLMLGEVSRKLAEVMHEKETFDFFVNCTMRSIPKSRAQTEGEIRVTRAFFENFSGDQVRFLCEAKQTPGDHTGQFATGYRWPFGAVGVITPFNFPLEIPVL
jgi:1-pyrroline-5-carboxylate dehydrogenase